MIKEKKKPRLASRPNMVKNTIINKLLIQVFA